MSASLTLYDLSAELVQLMDAWDDPDLTPEYREQIEKQLRVFAEAHVKKVDGIRQYLRHCEQMVAAAREEQARQKQHADAWQARYGRLKEVCKYVMQTFQAKRFDGNTGSLILATNGGKQPVEITDASLIPDEYCVYEGAIPAFIWKPLIGLAAEVAHMSPGGQKEEMLRDIQGLQLKRVPRLSLIEAALQKPCETCHGTGQVTLENWLCESCGGSGKQGVPGCRLQERGQHVEVR